MTSITKETPIDTYFKDFQANNGTHFDILKNTIQAIHKTEFFDTNIDIFKNYSLFKRNTEINSGIDEKGCIFNDDFDEPEDEYIMCDKKTFQKKFNELTNNIFHFFDWDNVVVAGGVVNLAIMSNDLPKKLDDIDFFLHGVDESKAMKIITKICDSIKDIVPKSYAIKTSKTVTLMIPKPYRNLQFVTTLFNNKEDILHNFDLQSSKVLYDGETV